MKKWKPKPNSYPLILNPCEYLHQGQQHPRQHAGVSPSLTWKWLDLPRPVSCHGCSLSLLVDRHDHLLIMVPARSVVSSAGPHCQEFSKDKQSVSFRDVKLARHHFSSESQPGRKCQKHIPCASVLYAGTTMNATFKITVLQEHEKDFSFREVTSSRTQPWYTSWAKGQVSGCSKTITSTELPVKIIFVTEPQLHLLFCKRFARNKSSRVFSVCGLPAPQILLVFQSSTWEIYCLKCSKRLILRLKASLKRDVFISKGKIHKRKNGILNILCKTLKCN